MNIVYALKLFISCLMVSFAFVFYNDFGSYYALGLITLAIAIQFFGPKRSQHQTLSDSQRQEVIQASSTSLRWSSSPIFWLGIPTVLIIIISLVL
ncbi:hypothetical protein QX776_01755 [Alteromonadaceae bacterium BrNp21-10]|nr:hypothetical protein [Alteromonadaceae bacterium BrNp21-10]